MALPCSFAALPIAYVDGSLISLQVVLQEQQKPQDGEQVARQLMEELGVREEDLLPGAYLDLLLAGGEPQLPG